MGDQVGYSEGGAEDIVKDPKGSVGEEAEPGKAVVFQGDCQNEQDTAEIGEQADGEKEASCCKQGDGRNRRVDQKENAGLPQGRGVALFGMEVVEEGVEHRHKADGTPGKLVGTQEDEA